MKVITKIVGGLMTMAFSTQLLASESVVVKVDKGELVLQYDANLDEPYDVTAVMPSVCPASSKVEVDKGFDAGKNTLSVKHTGDNCSRGATITVTLGSAVQSVEASLSSGVVTLKSSVMSASSKVQATVQAGVIQSSLIPVKTINNYAGKSGVYLDSQGGKKLQLNVEVKAGVIKTP